MGTDGGPNPLSPFPILSRGRPEEGDVGAHSYAPIGIKIRKKGDKGTHFVDADGVESSSIHEGASR
jgi:hypothetical protein